jgi:hypothetical protein
MERRAWGIAQRRYGGRWGLRSEGWWATWAGVVHGRGGGG